MQKKNGHKMRTEFKHVATFQLHEDAKRALSQIASALPNYPKYMLASFAIMYLKKEIDRQKIGGADDLEERLDLLT